MAVILQVSDVHFGPPHRLDASGAVLDLATALGPDLVVVSGDLTQRAKPEQFRQAREWLDRFAVPTIAVPGNHDVPMYRVAERLFAPFGAWRRHFGGPLEPTHRGERVWAFGFNSAQAFTVKEGRVRLARLAAVEAEVAAAPEGVPRLAVVHHQLVPPPRFGEQRVAANAGCALETFARLDIELVLSGHEHRGWVARSEDYWPRAPGVVLVHSGTSSSTRGRAHECDLCTANRIEIGPRTIDIVRLVFDQERGFLADAEYRLPRRRVRCS